MQTITNPTTDRPPLAPPPDLPPLRFYRRRRFLRISWFFFRVIAHVFFFDILLGRFRLTRWYARRSGLERWRGIARRFRGLAAQMGGVLIKLGQFLSSRADILPAAITDELAGLQDEVPAAPLPYILATIVEECGAPPDTLFAHFNPTPVAAASFGQVYFAVLRDGREVAIKVQRPRIEEIVDVDLRAVQWAVRVIRNYPAIRRRADLLALFDEFERVLRKELDYVLEAHNAEIFRANFANVPGVYIPAPYADLTTKRVLIMERIGGIKISDTAALDRAGIDRSELAHRFYRAYLKQWFLDGIFHADPHPGNLFVRVDEGLRMEDGGWRMEDGRPSSIIHPSSSKPEQATTPVAGERLNGDAQAGGPRPGTPCTLIFIDFGMVERISSRIMEALHENTIAVAANDPERFVESLYRAGMILPGADRRQLILAAQILFRHTYDRSIRELTNIDVEEVFREVEGLVRELPFQMPQDLIYLGRSVGMVAGMATTLDRDMNLFETLRPFAQEMMAREQRQGSLVDRLRQEATTLGQIGITLPRQMDAYYKAANRGDLQMRVDLGRLERGMRRVERATNRLAGGIIATGLFIGGVLLRINGFADETIWAWVAAALVALWALWPRGDR